MKDLEKAAFYNYYILFIMLSYLLLITTYNKGNHDLLFTIANMYRKANLF